MRSRKIVALATRWSHGQAPSRAFSSGWGLEHCVRYPCLSRSPILESPSFLSELRTDPKLQEGRRLTARLLRKWTQRQGRGPGLQAVVRAPSRGATSSVLTRKGIRTSSWNHESHEMTRKNGSLGGVEPCPRSVRGFGLLQVFSRASFSYYYLSESSHAVRIGLGLRSADLQSAVAPNCIRRAASEIEALGNFPSLADCKSALRQNAILRYFGSGCATPSISSASWLLNCPFEVHIISLFSSQPPPRRFLARPQRGCQKVPKGAKRCSEVCLPPLSLFQNPVAADVSPRHSRGFAPTNVGDYEVLKDPPLIQGFRGRPCKIQVGRAFPRAGLCRPQREEVGLGFLTGSCLVMFGHVWSLQPRRAKNGLISVCLGSGFHLRASSPLCRRARPRKRRQNPPNSAKFRQIPPFDGQDIRRLGIWLLCVST